MTADALITDPTLQSVLRAAAKAREQSLAILDLLESYHSEGAPAEEQQQLSLSKQHKLLNAYLAQLRALDRKAILGVRSTKQETAEARQEIDALHLQLQNLYYEQRHLRGEIAGCEEYEHRYTTLPMIPQEEFLAQHPEHAESSEHGLTVARIQDELVARQALEEQRLVLAKRKEALVKETTAKKDELGKLDVEVEKWVNGQAGARAVFEAHYKKIEEARARDGQAQA